MTPHSTSDHTALNTPVSPDEARSVVLRATEQSEVSNAVEWIADDLPLADGVDARLLIRALLALDLSDDQRRSAIRTVTRKLAASELDSAEMLFAIDDVPTPAAYCAALALLASKCRTGGLDSVDADALLEAQREDLFAIEALCAVAGVSYKELNARLTGTSGTSELSRLSPADAKAAFKLIDGIVSGAVTAPIAGAAPARPIELMRGLGSAGTGWAEVERLRTKGVPYEVLLAQRAVGGAWLAHRNRTSSKLAPLIAEQLCELLDGDGVKYLRSSSVGGKTAPIEIARQSASDKQVGVLAHDRNGDPAFAVIFSTARDHGTARANAGRLMSMERNGALPTAVVIVGPGWAKRHETADLASAFDGRIYSESALRDLAAEIKHTVRNRNRRAD